MKDVNFWALKEAIGTEKKAVNELNSSLNHLENATDREERRIIGEHIEKLKNSFKKANEEVVSELEKINLATPLKKTEKKPKPKILLEKKPKKISFGKGLGRGLSQLEKETIKRIRRGGEKVEAIETEKPKKYVEMSNKYFYNSAQKLSKNKNFETLKKDLIKTNLEFTPVTYISMMLFTTVISVIAAFFIFLFFLIFKIGGESLISIAAENFVMRFLKTFWILFAIPIGVFLFMYFYPSLEKKSTEKRIDEELPFCAIHMAAISESMIEPSKIFSIIITTKEYPYLRKEFTKLINKINIYGYDLVSALKSTSQNSPSKKLAELLNGLAVTINSGGDLTDFFEKRSQTLLFEHRLEREKNTKTAETFMDIYISVVIAAPMILMLLLMMMKISGLGISLGTGSITLIMVLGVAVINAAFLSFLHLRRPTG